MGGRPRLNAAIEQRSPQEIAVDDPRICVCDVGQPPPYICDQFEDDDTGNCLTCYHAAECHEEPK